MNAPNGPSHSDSSRRNFLRQTSLGIAGAAAAARRCRWSTRRAGRA